MTNFEEMSDTELIGLQNAVNAEIAKRFLLGVPRAPQKAKVKAQSIEADPVCRRIDSFRERISYILNLLETKAKGTAINLGGRRGAVQADFNKANAESMLMEAYKNKEVLNEYLSACTSDTQQVVYVFGLFFKRKVMGNLTKAFIAQGITEDTEASSDPDYVQSALSRAPTNPSIKELLDELMPE